MTRKINLFVVIYSKENIGHVNAIAKSEVFPLTQVVVCIGVDVFVDFVAANV